jgi:hypothetical protein
MGQYHSIYNITKKQYFRVGGAKLWEQVHAATSQALLMLLANSNGRGGGDFDHNSELIGSWAGDKILVQGDYAEKGDKAFLSDKKLESFTDITDLVFSMLEANPYCDEVQTIIKREKDWEKQWAKMRG